MKKYYEVILPAIKAPTFFEAIDGADYQPNQKVVTESARGKELGTISAAPPVYANSSPNKVETLSNTNKHSTPSLIIGAASKENIVLAKEQELQAAQALKIIKARVIYHNLPMNILSAYITLDGTRIIIEFYAEQRIDFRVLVHDLAARLKKRVELRQIGPRDRAILVGGRGVCCRRLCCSSWLRDFSSVSIKMAKNQKMPLAPGKVSGACGRLMCCLKFESPNNNQ
ncbi:MAG: stage 0 sporulation family protein [Candidatus Bruticola sp.]